MVDLGIARWAREQPENTIPAVIVATTVNADFMKNLLVGFVSDAPF